LHRAPDVAGRLILDTVGVDEIRVDDRDRLKPLRSWLKATAPSLADAVRGDPLDLTEEVPALLSAEIPLSKGGSIVIEPTRALTAIDVNAGGAADYFQVNREASRAIARQLRLRNIGGIVVVDFISMKRRDSRNALVDAFRGALDGDPAHIRMSRGMSGLGLIELARERRGLGLAEVMGGQ
jgi:Rne/Rng family ribonuclease